jgi:uncharacterized protein YjbI with pentapeptide repeats
MRRGEWDVGAFIGNSLPVLIVAVMVDGTDKHATDGKEARKRTWRRSPQDRPRESKPWTLKEFGGKSVWDWLHLLSALAIPVVITLGTLWFTAQQNEQQQLIEERRAQAERELEEQRANAERELEAQRAQDTAFQAYLDEMTQLLLEKNLRESEEDSEVRTLAQARTTTALATLDATYRDKLVQFLLDADLLGVGADPPSISVLKNADMPGINLEGMDLGGTDLSGANLSEANLQNADLVGTNLRGALLGKAKLNGAYLASAELHDSYLAESDLSHAYLFNAYLSDACLQGANLSDAVLQQAHLDNATLAQADLSGAGLTDADLRGANFHNADLSRANLSGADLSSAVLGDADLSDAKVTDEQLSQAASLQGATMPDGSKVGELYDFKTYC